MPFDIPSQPLASALESYAVTSGFEVFYSSGLAAGRVSTAVAGQLARDVALSILLEGTGLSAVYESRAFSIMPASVEPRRGPDDSRYLPYFALIQGAIEQAFCRLPEATPGGYRLALRFRVGAIGDVQQVEVVGTAGNPKRDAAISTMLDALNIGQPPPPEMPQPVTMLVSPRPPVRTGDCQRPEGRPTRHLVR